VQREVYFLFPCSVILLISVVFPLPLLPILVSAVLSFHINFAPFSVLLQAKKDTSAKQVVLGRTNRLLSFDTTRTALKTTTATVRSCRGNVFTKLSPNNDKGLHSQTHRHTLSMILLKPLERVYRAVA
jgi:hypothetical protein